MSTEPETQIQANTPEEALAQIFNQPKRQFTPEEISKARGNLELMNDRVFLATLHGQQK